MSWVGARKGKEAAEVKANPTQTETGLILPRESFLAGSETDQGLMLKAHIIALAPQHRASLCERM